MTDEQKQERASQLQEMLSSPGGRILFEHIDDEIRTGWDEFIKLPVLSKTSKAAMNYQAKYEVLKNLKDWVDSEIKVGE